MESHTEMQVATREVEKTRSGAGAGRRGRGRIRRRADTEGRKEWRAEKLEMGRELQESREGEEVERRRGEKGAKSQSKKGKKNGQVKEGGSENSWKETEV